MNTRQRCLIFDPFAGISGDMILGGLVDLGLPVSWLERLVSSLPLTARLEIRRVKRGALSTRAVTVKSDEPQPPRALGDVLEIIEAAGLHPFAHENATAVFRRIAQVEGSLHGLPPERVNFHEVGAADSIVDVIGVTAGLQELGVTTCFTRPVAVGRGWIDTQHGKLPIPAPATLKLLEGLPTAESEFVDELATPTGAALLAVLTEGRRAPPSFTPIRSGFGAGSRDPTTHPNCLRLVLAEIDESPRQLLLLQADIDDMPPEYLPPLVDALLAAGALDVWTHTVQMKKGRTGTRLEALVPRPRCEEVGRALFQGSTTLGLRFWGVEREVLPRATNTIEWQGHIIRIKSSTTPDGHLRHKPEYDDVLEASRATGTPVWRVRQEIEGLLRAGP